MTRNANKNAFLSARKLCPTILPHRIGVLAQIERFSSKNKTGDRKVSGCGSTASNTLLPAHLPLSHAVRAQLQVIRASKAKSSDARATTKTRTQTLRPLLVASSLPNRVAVLAQISALRGEKARLVSDPTTQKMRFQTRLA